MPAVRERHEDLGLAEVIAEALALELKVVDDPLAEHDQHLGAGRQLEAGDQLPGNAGAADPLAALEDEGRQPVLRQIAGGDQAVVPGANHDRTVFGLHAASPRQIR